jgi:hypothetical protein
MRKSFLALSAAAVAATAMVASPASAQSRRDHGHHHHHARVAAPVAGAIVGTAVGVGLHNNWYGTNGSFWGANWQTGVAGAATTGFVAGVGTAALIHAATTPCQGFHALFGNFLTSSEGCVNGQWVGYREGAPRRAMRVR